MSSFLDSTGLSRLVSKITDYFAKKDGSYPNMNVGTVNGYTVEKSVPSNAVFTDTTYPKAVKNITRSGTTFTATCYDGTTFTFTQQDNNTTYSAGSGLSLSGTTFSLKTGYTTSGKNYKVQLDSSGNPYVNVPWTDNNSTYPKAIKNITRSGTTFTATCYDDTTFTFTQQDNNTTYSAGSGLSLSGTTFSLKTGYTTSGKNYKVQLDSSGNPYVNVPWTDNNTWRGIQDNLTSSTNTTESLSAKQGYLLANGSARDSTKSPTTHTHSVSINGSTKTIAASGGTAVNLGTMFEQITKNNTSSAYNFNTMISTGFHLLNVNADSSTGAAQNGRQVVLVFDCQSSRCVQISLGYYFKARFNNGSSWSPWRTISTLGGS